jgi:hypothetical protein
MPHKQAPLVFDRCHPAQCHHGTCLAAPACPHRLIQHEPSYEMPVIHLKRTVAVAIVPGPVPWRPSGYSEHSES